MTASTIGVIYSKDTGQILRVVVPDSDAELALHVGEGEALQSYGTAKYARTNHKDFHAELALIIEKATTKRFVPTLEAAETTVDPLIKPGEVLPEDKDEVLALMEKRRQALKG